MAKKEDGMSFQLLFLLFINLIAIAYCLGMLYNKIKQEKGVIYMDAAEIFAHVDHTILKAVASHEEVMKICEEALKYRMASVCLPPSYVKAVKQAFPDSLNICTVIGFPLGYNKTSVKAFEIEEAAADGASELDVVINLGDVKNKKYGSIENEIVLLKKACGKNVLKVIIETCFLTEEEKIEMCKRATNGGADYIKTSTGFGDRGAAMSDIELFKKHIGPGVKIKAAGGIRSREDMEAYLKAGCERLGTSSAMKLLS
jgi:deoxyribose-phosphate aldolase